MESPMPIRVIDVAATLGNMRGICFGRREAWDFHLLSHTWSQQVREFSHEIGCQICTSRRDMSYNDAFRVANFGEHECYNKLTELLRLLQDDGVAYVWFDALCINQADEREKTEEIVNMGAYYTNSKGCYVLTHGIGRGYNLCNGDLWPKYRYPEDYWQTNCPRWFTRAWTLQECVLPKKLSFLVMFHRRMIRWMNCYIAFKRSRVGFCKCCRGPREFWWQFWDRQLGPSEFCDEYRILDTKHSQQVIYEIDEECKECSTYPLVRKAKKAAAATEKMTYFVDKEAFAIVADLYCWVTQIFGSGEDDYKPIHRARLPVDCLVPQLYGLLALRSDSVHPFTVARHIANRDCTNEEDRILCILGLLGVRNIKQIRSKLSLEDQILSMCNQNHDLLIQLCTMSIKGYTKSGMSWAPFLVPDKGNDDFMNWVTRDHKPQPDPLHRRSGELVQKVCREGITLLAKVARTRVIPCHRGIPSHRNEYCVVLCDDSARNLYNLWDIGQLKMNVPSYPKEDCIGYLKVDLKDYPDQVAFDMWWILLGDSYYKGQVYKLVMACIGKGPQNLHKIGLFWISERPAHAIFFQNPRECIVGGFGLYLDEHVTKAIEA